MTRCRPAVTARWPSAATWSWLVPLALFVAVLCTPPVPARPLPNTPAPGTSDAAALDKKIIDEAKQGSELLANLTYLSDVIGPRLTGTPALKKANEWAAEKMRSYGLTDVHLEGWTIPVGWERGTATMRIVEPDNGHALTVAAMAWTPSTEGKVTGDVVILRARSSKELAAFKGKLKNAIVLQGAPTEIAPVTETNYFSAEGRGRRGGRGGAGAPGAPAGPGGPGAPGAPAAAPAGPGGAPAANPAAKPEPKLAEKADAKTNPDAKPSSNSETKPGDKPEAKADPQPPAGGRGGRGGPGGQQFDTQFFQQMMAFRKELREFLHTEGAAAVLMDSGKPHGLLNMTGSWQGGDRASAADPLPTLFVAHEHYAQLYRLASRPAPAKTRVEVEIHNKITPGPIPVYNTVGEIKGSEKPDEFVVLGAHLDSWDLAQGTTDNGTGSCVVLEAARLLAKSGIKPKRTIRFILFTGEEQGLFGSKAYVKAHEAEMPKCSMALVHDTGTGKVVGIGLQGRDAVKPILDEELTAFKELGCYDLNLRSMPGSDHMSFDEAGVPGFAVQQDWAEYRFTHHSQSDTLDKAKEPDLIQGAQVLAVAAVRVANLPNLLPHGKPVRQRGGRGGAAAAAAAAEANKPEAKTEAKDAAKEKEKAGKK
jgi:hypothetical protein